MEKINFTIIKTNKKTIAWIIITVILLIIQYILCDNITIFLINTLPEITGIIITYNFIEWLIKNSEEKKVKSYKLLLFNRISGAIYDIASGIGDIDTPENSGKNKYDVIKNGKNELSECLNIGVQLYSEDIINNISQVYDLLDMYFFEYDIIGDEETYLNTAKKILPLLRELLTLINKNQFYSLIDQAIANIEFELEGYS